MRASVCRCPVASHFCHPMGCSQPVSCALGIFQARILEQVAISFSRGFSLLRVQTQLFCISCIGRWVLYQLRLFIIIYKELEKSVQNISSTSILVTILWMKKLLERILNGKYFYQQVTKTWCHYCYQNSVLKKKFQYWIKSQW